MHITGLNAGENGWKKDALLASKIYKSVKAKFNLNILVGIKVFKLCSTLRERNPKGVGGDVLPVFMNTNYL